MVKIIKMLINDVNWQSNRFRSNFCSIQSLFSICYCYYPIDKTFFAINRVNKIVLNNFFCLWCVFLGFFFWSSKQVGLTVVWIKKKKVKLSSACLVQGRSNFLYLLDKEDLILKFNARAQQKQKKKEEVKNTQNTVGQQNLKDSNDLRKQM